MWTSVTNALSFTDVDTVQLDAVSAASLSLTAAGATQTAPVNTSTLDLNSAAAGSFVLDSASNDIDVLTGSLAGADLTLVDGNSVTLAATSVRDITLMATDVSQSGALTARNVRLIGSAAGSLTLDDPGNSLQRIDAAAGTGNVRVRNAAALAVGALTGAVVTLDAPMLGQVAGTGITATSLSLLGGTVNLLAGVNDVGTLTATLGGDLAFADSNAVDLGATDVVGDLTLVAQSVTSTAGVSAAMLDVAGVMVSNTLTGGLDIDRLNTGSGAAAITLGGAVNVASATTFANTGGVTLGTSDSDVLNFDGALTSVSSTTSVAGRITTGGATVIDALDVGSAAQLISAGANLDVGAIDGTAMAALTLDAGAGTVTTGDIGGIANLSVTGASIFLPTVGVSGDVDLNGASTVSGSLAADRLILSGASAVLADVTVNQVDSSAITTTTEFDGLLTADSVTSGGAGSYVLRGGAAVTNAVTLTNTGGVVLGDAPADSLVFSAGLTSTASPNTLAGALSAGGTGLVLGSVTLAADSSVISTAGMLQLGNTTGTDTQALTATAFADLTIGDVANLADLTLSGTVVNTGAVDVAGLASFSGATRIAGTLDAATARFSGTSVQADAALDVGSLDLAALNTSASFDAPVNAGALAAVGGSADIAFNAGGTFDGSVDISSSGSLILDGTSQAVTFNGPLLRTAGNTVASGTLAFNAGAALAATSLAAPTSVLVDGGDLTMGSVTGADQAWTISAAGRRVTIGELQAGGQTTVVAADFATVGALVASGVDVSGVSGSATFGGLLATPALQPVIDSAAITLAGGANIGAGVTFANTGSVVLDGRASAVRVAGNLVSTAGTTSLAGRIDAGAADVSLGTTALTAPVQLVADELVVSGALTGGALDIGGVTGSASLTAPVMLDTLTVGANSSVVSLAGGRIANHVSFDNSGGVMLDGRTATLTLAGGASSTAGDTRLAGTLVTRGTPLTLAAVEVFDDLALSTGGGALTTAALTAGTNDVVIDAAGGSVTTGAVSSGADVVISAATTALASFGVDGAVSIDATGIAIDGDSRADAGVTFGGATMLSGNLTTAGTPITVMPGRRLTLGDSVRLASGGGDISADAIDGGGFALELMPEDGRIDVGEIAAAGSLLASGTGVARLGSVEASGRVELALAELRLGQRVTGGSIVLDGPVSMTDATVALTGRHTERQWRDFRQRCAGAERHRQHRARVRYRQCHCARR